MAPLRSPLNPPSFRTWRHSPHNDHEWRHFSCRQDENHQKHHDGIKNQRPVTWLATTSWRHNTSAIHACAIRVLEVNDSSNSQKSDRHKLDTVNYGYKGYRSIGQSDIWQFFCSRYWKSIQIFSVMMDNQVKEQNRLIPKCLLCPRFTYLKWDGIVIHNHNQIPLVLVLYFEEFSFMARFPRNFSNDTNLNHRHLSRPHLCLTYVTHRRTPIKYVLNLRFIQPLLTWSYTGPRVCAFFVHYIFSKRGVYEVMASIKASSRC